MQNVHLWNDTKLLKNNRVADKPQCRDLNDEQTQVKAKSDGQQKNVCGNCAHSSACRLLYHVAFFFNKKLSRPARDFFVNLNRSSSREAGRCSMQPDLDKKLKSAVFGTLNANQSHLETTTTSQKLTFCFNHIWQYARKGWRSNTAVRKSWGTKNKCHSYAHKKKISACLLKKVLQSRKKDRIIIKPLTNRAQRGKLVWQRKEMSGLRHYQLEHKIKGKLKKFTKSRLLCWLTN